MTSKRTRTPGPQKHAEGSHGRATHRRFIEQLQEGTGARKQTEGAPVDGHHRLHEDREQHDEAEKSSEKVEAIREVRRGKIDENVIAHSRIEHESDST